jgi:hypothetical protein
MTMRFASTLRTRDETMQVGAGAAGDSITIRVQMAEVWDVVRISAGRQTQVSVIKEAALERLLPDFVSTADFYLRLNGFEVLDESASLEDEGVRDGSTLLLTFRRRRPVR